MDGFAYLTGTEAPAPGPLARYLPPLPEGVAPAFLAQHAGPGSWVLDPFGAAPRLGIEMARYGYRVLVAVNNPVTRFLFELNADPPSVTDLRAALADLAAARKGDERLETHLQSLYLTNCTKCQRTIQADAFVWERGAKSPSARIYRCPCGEAGEFPITEADQERASLMAATEGLHRSRALERLAGSDDPDRVHAVEALECYLPRAVYVLTTIINKLDSLSLPLERRRGLMALILSACDEANTLWPYPTERPRPKQLTVPPRFLEKNIWRALEQAVDDWTNSAAPLPLTVWPALPPESGGVCIFEGPLRDLAPRLNEIPMGAVVTALPRPNQAFWTLSALWAGWLWGREAVGAFRSVLRRRRYDWNWHAGALQAALKNLSTHLPLNTPVFAFLAEAEPSFLSAALLAASGAGFDLHGLAIRSRHDPLQIVWYRRAFTLENKDQIDTEVVRKGMLDALLQRGEPMPYLHLHAASLIAMAEDHTLNWREEALAQLHIPIQAALTGAEFVHHGASENPELGLWGLSAWDVDLEPFPDRIEVSAVRFLQKKTDCSLDELEASLDAEFTGLDTPSLGLLQAVLASYAIEKNGRWEIRPEDSPSARRADLESAAQTLEAIATRLGYSAVRQESPRRMVIWQEAGRNVASFHLLASAVCGRLLRQPPEPSERHLLVLPGGRAGLLAYKFQRDPSLKPLADSWRILKFRALRRLGSSPTLNKAEWEKELSADPLEPPEQMKLF